MRAYIQHLPAGSDQTAQSLDDVRLPCSIGEGSIVAPICAHAKTRERTAAGKNRHWVGREPVQQGMNGVGNPGRTIGRPGNSRPDANRYSLNEFCDATLNHGLFPYTASKDTGMIVHHTPVAERFGTPAWRVLRCRYAGFHPGLCYFHSA